MQQTYTCPKCSNTSFSTEEIRVSGGVLSSIFDVENKAYTAIICTKCKYTEFYQATRGELGKILDFFTT